MSWLRQHAVEFLQLREKDLPTRDLAELARDLLVALGGDAGRPRLLISNRPDVAAAIGADGVHLPSGPGELRPEDVRQVFRLCGRPEPVVSLSCHTLADVRRGCDGGASYLLFGPVFAKRVRGDRVLPGTGVALLGEACRLAGATPVLALGGVTPETSAACLCAGAAGVAGIRLFLPVA